MADGEKDPWAEYPSTTAKEAETVQPHVTKVIATLPHNTACCLIDAHDRASFADRKPDIIVAPTHMKFTPDHPSAQEKLTTSKPSLPSSFYIVGLGDVKGRRDKGEFKDQELGELVSFLLALLQERPDRMKVRPWKKSAIKPSL